MRVKKTKTGGERILRECDFQEGRPKKDDRNSFIERTLVSMTG